MSQIISSNLVPTGSSSCISFSYSSHYPGLHALRLRNRVTQSFRYAKGSAANIVSGIRQYLYFTLSFALQILPASGDTVICFMEFMSATSSYEHLKHLLFSVKFLHQAYDLDFPENSFKLDMTMQGLKRRLARVPYQVLPITPKILREMYRHLDMRKNEDLALWCSFLVSFYGLLRKKNSVPESSTYESSKVLTRRNFSIDLNNNCIYMYMGFSKTNQFGARDLVLPIPGNSDSALDPVRHLQELFLRVPALPNAPAFTHGRGRFITYTKFTTRLKSLLTSAGYTASQFSGHSFRRGGASFLHACGGTTLMVQAAGDWTSNCFTRYLFLSVEQRLVAQNLMSSAINQGA